MPERLVELLARQQRAATESLQPQALDYIAGGGGEEVSVREAESAWREHRLLPHVLRDVSSIDTSTRVLGAALKMPLVAAPTAFHAVAHADAELGAARGIRAAGGLMVVATRSNTPVEDIAAELTPPWWFQVYVLRDRDITARVVERAVRCGAGALMLTGDAPLLSRRRHAQSLPPLTRQQYLAAFSDHLRPDGRIEWDTAQDPTITLDTIGWLSRMSGLPVLVKGVLRADDAVACIDAGAAGVVVSNHGGRQLDRAIASARALPEVAAAVRDRGVVLVDGGIRSGIDVLIACALGAHAALVGRPLIWALAAEGASGVQAVLEAFHDDFREAMALAGVRDIAGIVSDLVLSPR